MNLRAMQQGGSASGPITKEIGEELEDQVVADSKNQLHTELQSRSLQCIRCRLLGSHRLPVCFLEIPAKSAVAAEGPRSTDRNNLRNHMKQEGIHTL